jgi:hypothetical protein
MIQVRRLSVLCTALVLCGCASTVTPTTSAVVSPTAGPQSPDATSSAAAAGPLALEGGDLAAGVVHYSDALGLSVQPTEDDWFALMAGDTDFELTRERIAVWFVQPASIRPDGTAASTEDAPTDPAAFADALEGHPAVSVVGTEPFSAGALDGLLVDFESSGMTEGSAMLVTSDGAAFGVPDGEGRVVLLTTGAGLVMISIEGGASRDAAWEIVEPLLITMDAAP